MFPFLRTGREFAIHSEDKAASWLIKKGYKIIKRNFRSYCGEIDLIATKGNVLHFVEVKARRSFCYGTPGEAVNGHKKRKMTRTAEVFLRYFPEFKNYELKFDFLSLSYHGKSVEFELIENILM